MSPERILVSLITTGQAAQVQNALMTVSDRDLALSLRHLSEHERTAVLTRVSGSKAGRVHAEILMQRRLGIEQRQYLEAIQRVIARVRGESSKPVASYLRPRRPRADYG